MKIYHFIFLGIFFSACSNPKSEKGNGTSVETKEDAELASIQAEAVTDSIPNNISAKTYKNTGPEGGFGFDIFKDNQLMIHQPTIPAIQGSKGFQSEEQAQKTADLMLSKLQKGIMPPAISMEDLDSLGILF